MDLSYISLGLMALGVVIYLIGRLQGKRTNVSATKNSVAVGGNNSGAISNTQTGGPGGHGVITIISILVELIGIALGLLHILHKAG